MSTTDWSITSKSKATPGRPAPNSHRASRYRTGEAAMKASKKHHPTAAIGTPRRKQVTTNAVKKTDRSPRRRKTRVAADKPESGPRLGELAYRGVLEGLFDRRVPAGSFFSQSELARLLNLPIQPLRDALRVLETEGILTIHARSGIEFLKADLELARSTYQYRS